MLINGIRFGNLHSSGRMPTFRMPVSAIERIEIIRGPGSALYGADAFAGVINVITKSGAEIDGVRVPARRGSFDSTDGLLQWGTQAGDWKFGVSIESQRSEGDDDRKIETDYQTILDRIFGTSASFAPGQLQTNYDILDTHLSLTNEHWSAHFWNWQQNGGGQGAGAADTLDPVGRQEVDQNLFDIGYTSASNIPLWEIGFHYSYQHTRNRATFQIFPSGTVLPIGSSGNVNFVSPVGLVQFPDGLHGNPGSDEDIHFADVFAEYVGFENHRIRLGAGGRSEQLENYETKNFGPGVIDGTQPIVDGALTQVRGTPYIFMPDKTRISRFALMQDEWAFAPDWELTAGVRYDRYSDFGDTTNPRLALVWSTSYNLTSKLLYGRAFRAPSLSELYFINNPSVLGNPNLRPETIDTVELAFDYRPSAALQWNLSLLDYRAKDLIEFITDPGTAAKTAQNARNQNGRGLELEMSWSISDAWHLRANYAYQNSEDEDTGVAIHDVPQKHFYANLTFKPETAWQASAQLNWVGGRRRAEGDPRPAIDDYAWANVTLRHTSVLPGLSMALSVRNVFNADAREPSNGNIDDYPLEGRSAWFEVAYRFSQ
jgi:iron complex outermembrane receptor protein